MKKLIAILASTSIIASAATTVVACGTIKEIKNKTVLYNEQDIDILLKQVSKAYYLNNKQTNNYDFNYVYQNQIKNKFILDLDVEAEVSNTNNITKYGRMNDIQTVYFGDELINSNLKDKSQIEIQNGDMPKNKNLIMNLADIYPHII